MRHSLALTATVLALAWAAPASAQMCGGQTTGSTAAAPATGGGMCGMMRGSATATDPMATPAPQPGQRAGGCPCCGRMAMMQGGQSGGMGGMMGGGGAPQGSPAPAPAPAPSAPATPQ